MFKSKNKYEHLLMMILEADENLEKGILSEEEVDKIYYEISIALKKIDSDKAKSYFEDILKNIVK